MGEIKELNSSSAVQWAIIPANQTPGEIEINNVEWGRSRIIPQYYLSSRYIPLTSLSQFHIEDNFPVPMTESL